MEAVIFCNTETELWRTEMTTLSLSGIDQASVHMGTVTLNIWDERNERADDRVARRNWSLGRFPQWFARM